MSVAVSVWLLSQRGQAGARCADPLQRGDLERRHDRVRQPRPAGPGEQLDDTRPEDLLELDVEERPPPDRRQDVGQGRHAQRLEGGRAQRVDPVRSPVGALERRVVADHGDPVGRGPDVELEAVAGGDRQGGGECGDAVLGRPAPVAAVRQPERSSRALPYPSPISSWAAIPRWSLG